MKIGRNEACPCGSGIKYKKCCLDKERIAPINEEEDAIFKNLADKEMLMKVFANMREYILSRKAHIKEYKKVRKLHNEVVGSMVDYYDNDNFERKIDPNYVDEPPTPRNYKPKIAMYNCDFDMDTQMGSESFYDMMIYKSSPNLTCITEEYIASKRFRKPEKIEMLNSMMDSRAGLFV